ncbi:unnamed protein product [Vicia faba]|uniref:Reverse transcriptase zinc-binding domain-containing protein n=1 Tax=Vicia faba TaxID=3906 RepID=A0AAV1AKG3_VICFA|nr:unnamed protein product [Vicia faba]
MARPRAFVLWLACNGRLATKDRLRRFGLINDENCIFCHQRETHNHLFFGCHTLKDVWLKVLMWLQVVHDPKEWHEELPWMMQTCNGKRWKYAFLKCAVTETMYHVWKHRN